MAAIQQRGKSVRILFRFRGKQRCLRLGTIDIAQAESRLAEVEELLSLLDKGRLTLPPELDIVTFLEHDGKVPEDLPLATPTSQNLDLGGLQDSYLGTHSQGTLEENSLATCRYHFAHLVTHFGKKFRLRELVGAHLQKYIENRASKGISPTTIKKGSWS